MDFLATLGVPMANKQHLQDEVDGLIAKHRDSLTASTQSLKREPSNAKIFDNRICLTITEFAVRAGVSPKSVERLIKRGELHAKKLGRRVLIPTSAIEAWLKKE
jgi:excisionase family DNA binding protein